MDILGGPVAWFTDPANWQGPDGDPEPPLRAPRDLLLGVSWWVALVIASPSGSGSATPGGRSWPSTSPTSAEPCPRSRSSPSSFPITIASASFLPVDLAFAATLRAMVLLAVPPILINAYAGMHGVDRDLVEAARGLGMRGSQTLRRVELPLALPVILAGIRSPPSRSWRLPRWVRCSAAAAWAATSSRASLATTMPGRWPVPSWWHSSRWARSCSSDG